MNDVVAMNVCRMTIRNVAFGKSENGPWPRPVSRVATSAKAIVPVAV